MQKHVNTREGFMVKHLILISLFIVIQGCATHQDEGGLKVKDPTLKKAELYYDYGTNALVNKDYTKALINLKNAVDLVDDNSHFQNNLGMAYYFKGDITKAIHHLKLAVEHDGKNSDAKNNLASIYFHQGRMSESKALYQEILRDLEYTKQFRVYYNLGLILLREKRTNKAISMFNKSIQENKSYCPAHYQLGVMAMEGHRYHQATLHFENAYSGTCNENPDPYLKEALSYLNMGEYGKALVKMEKLVEKFPKSKEAVLARRRIQSIKVNELRRNEKQALQYQMDKLRNKLEESKAKETEEKKVDSLQF